MTRNIRDFAGDGLFTAKTEEPNWAKAHRLLMPAFGPILGQEAGWAIRSYLDTVRQD